MPDTWEELFQIPYGDTPDTLGTYLGGDGEGIWIGPDYGAQAPDGTWWFLDTAKLRLAHYSGSGEYIDEVVLPESMLVNGMYFQYQMPRVLEDGTLLASRLDGVRTYFLRLKDDTLDSFTISYEMVPRTDDGSKLYGFSFDENSVLVAVDPVAETAEQAEWMLTRTGDRFRLAGGSAGLVVELPDANPATTLDLELEAAEIGGGVYTLVEAVTDADGTLHLFLLGFPMLDESFQLAGYLTISPDGVVSAIEPMMNPFTEADTGSPARLGIRPGTTDVTFMHIGNDGVRVYGRR